MTSAQDATFSTDAVIYERQPWWQVDLPPMPASHRYLRVEVRLSADRLGNLPQLDGATVWLR